MTSTHPRVLVLEDRPAADLGDVLSRQSVYGFGPRRGLGEEEVWMAKERRDRATRSLSPSPRRPWTTFGSGGEGMEEEWQARLEAYRAGRGAEGRPFRGVTGAWMSF